MLMKDLLSDWKRFITKDSLVIEGGNATAVVYGRDGTAESVMWNGQPAQAKPIVFDEKVSRANFTQDVKDAIRKIDDEHRNTFNLELYQPDVRDEILDTGYVFMGSSEFLFAPRNQINDDEYVKHKKKTGDVDLLVPKDKIPTLYQLLNDMRGRQLSPTVKFVGHNKLTERQIKEEQINGIFEYSLGGRSFLFQVDFVFVPFDKTGRPAEEEKFLRGSTWEDITAGIKGIGHKLLLASLGSRIQTIPWGSALLATTTSKQDKVRLQVSLPKIANIRIGEPGIVPLDLKGLTSYTQISKIPKSFMKKVSPEEIERFVNSLDNNRIDMLNEILNKEGLAQNQTVSLLVSFIVHSPTVDDFKLDSYFKTFTSLMTFSMGRGLSTRYELEPYKVKGKDVYRYFKFDDREKKFRKAEDVFEAIFENRPTVEDVRDIASYLGLLRIINRYLSPEKKIAAYEGLFERFYEADNFMSAHDIEDDLYPKEVIMKAFETSVSEVTQSKKFINKEELVKTWIDRYTERLNK
tara:strand:- start:1071 stop:2630 length:1560 start_codon:yes stop_codon:yes gene_type:complete